MVLCLAIHTVSAVTAKVPFSMIALLDLVKKDLPPQLRCRQVFPTSGLRSSSLWDVSSDTETLQLWLDENLDVDCSNEVFEVQEEFAFGISAELTRLRTAERVTASTRATAAALNEKANQHMGEIDAKYKVSEHANAALKNVRETSQVAAKHTGAALARVGGAARESYSKALENERVAAAANALNANLSMGWKQLGKSYDYLKAQTARVPGSPGARTSSGGSIPETGSMAEARPSAATRPPTGEAEAPKGPTSLAQPAPRKPNTSDLFTLDDLEGEDAHRPHQTTGV